MFWVVGWFGLKCFGLLGDLSLSVLGCWVIWVVGYRVLLVVSVSTADQ